MQGCALPPTLSSARKRNRPKKYVFARGTHSKVETIVVCEVMIDVIEVIDATPFGGGIAGVDELMS